MGDQPEDASDDRRDPDTYEAKDGTIFDTRYRDAEDVYVADDQTVVVKPRKE